MVILVLFPISVARLSALRCWVLYWLCICHKLPKLCWDMFSLYSFWDMFSLYSFWWVFFFNISWYDVEIFQMLFLCPLRWSCDFFILCFVNLVCITLIDLHMMNHPCDPWSQLNPTWSWYVILLIYCWIQFANVLLRNFASILIKDIGL